MGTIMFDMTFNLLRIRNNSWNLSTMTFFESYVPLRDFWSHRATRLFEKRVTPSSYLKTEAPVLSVNCWKMRPLNMLNEWHKVSTEYSYLILSNECFEDILRSQRFTENSWPRIEMIYALGILQSQTAQTSMSSGKNYPTTTKLNEK